ncbi:MAG TPA: hypothetical protein VLA21_00570, partial [Candidatus Limnocylindria bacterium]|nr:hypothetical protein [Candidatus Limnocylindria bacterium]
MRWTMAGMACAAVACAADGPAPAQFLEAVASAHSRVAALESAWYRAACKEQEPEVLSVTLEKAVLNRDIQVRVFRSARIGTFAQGWAPTLNRNAHPVDVLSYDAQGQEAQGRLDIRGRIRLRFDANPLGQQMMEGLREAPATLSLKLTRNGGSVSGTYTLEGAALPAPAESKPQPSNPLRAAAGRVSGTLGKLARIPEADPARWAPGRQDGLEELYALGQALEGEADEWFQRLRALEIGRRKGMSCEAVLKDVVMPRVVRPALKLAEVKEAGTVDSVEIGDLIEDAGPQKKPPSSGGRPDKRGAQSDAETAREVLRAIADRAARMAAAVAEWEAGKRSAEFITDTLTVEDPEFGPWYGDRFLPAKDGVIRLPDEIGGPGAQEWQAVIDWQCLGPFPLSPFADSIPGLPDMVWGGDERCVLQADRLTSKTRAEDPIAWQDGKAKGISKDLTRGVFGFVMPPHWFAAIRYTSGITPMLGYRESKDTDGHGGQDYSTCYARCVIESPRDLEVWAGLGVNRE